MADLYLITGFLGTGKTTFLKNFIKLFHSSKIHLIINEFGKVGVDGKLLSEMNAVLDEINNGSIFCVCRLDKFEKVLSNALTNNPDIVLVETSGLSDPTNVQRVLSNDKFSSINYKGAICLVDTGRFEKVIDTAPVSRKQIVVSSVTLLNKIDIASTQQISIAKEKIKTVNPLTKVYETTFGELKKEWLEDIKPSNEIDEGSYGADITLQNSLVEVSDNMTVNQLKSFLQMLSEDTYRMKGFVLLSDIIYLVDCVGGMVNVSEYLSNGEVDSVGKIVLLAGRGMPLRKSLKEAIKWYSDYVKEVK